VTVMYLHNKVVNPQQMRENVHPTPSDEARLNLDSGRAYVAVCDTRAAHRPGQCLGLAEPRSHIRCIMVIV